MVLLKQKINYTNGSILLLFQAYLFFSCAHEQSQFEIRVQPEMVASSAAYGNLWIDSKEEKTLTEIQCTGYTTVEWHKSSSDARGIMRMRKVPFPITLKQNQMYSFVKGGDHLMLLGKKQPIKEGDQLGLTFIFSDLSKIQLFAKVVK